MQLPQALHHFFVGQVLVRDASAEVQNLPESNCESPHIALGRVFSLKIRCNSCYCILTHGLRLFHLNKLLYLDIRHTVEIKSYNLPEILTPRPSIVPATA